MPNHETPKECICDEMGWVEDCPRHSGAQPARGTPTAAPLSDEELVADDRWCPNCGDPREACLCKKGAPTPVREGAAEQFYSQRKDLPLHFCRSCTRDAFVFAEAYAAYVLAKRGK
jgi:hypothetical protein